MLKLFVAFLIHNLQNAGTNIEENRKPVEINFRRKLSTIKNTDNMITTSYNPSKLEIEIGEVIKSLQNEINSKLIGNSVEEISIDKNKDNPNLLIKLVDADGDRHEFVLKLIQRSDLIVNQQ